MKRHQNVHDHEKYSPQRCSYAPCCRAQKVWPDRCWIYSATVVGRNSTADPVVPWSPSPSVSWPWFHGTQERRQRREEEVMLTSIERRAVLFRRFCMRQSVPASWVASWVPGRSGTNTLRCRRTQNGRLLVVLPRSQLWPASVVIIDWVAFQFSRLRQI